MSPDLRLAIDAARRAGALIAERFTAAAGDAQRKAGGKGEVTETDTDAEALVLAALREGADHDVLSEEAGVLSRGDLGGDGGARWIVDPLDGTTNFSRRIPLFAVSIALMRGVQAELGVIYHPMSGDCYWAERGAGVHRNGERLHVSDTTDPGLAVLYLTHGYAAADRARFGQVLTRCVPRSYPRNLGSTAVELSFVAAGLGDGFVCAGDEIWDFAAGLVLVEEAGGRATDWRGQAWDGETRDTVITNGHIHDHVIDTIADLQEDR